MSVSTIKRLCTALPEYGEQIRSGLQALSSIADYNGIEQIPCLEEDGFHFKTINYLDIRRLLQVNRVEYKVIKRLTLIFSITQITINYSHRDNELQLISLLGKFQNLQQMEVVSDTEVEDQGDIYKLFLYNQKGLKRLFTTNIQFIYQYSSNDKEYFDQHTGLRQLATQIFSPVSKTSILSTAYFRNLTYLYLQTSVDLGEMVLEHDNLQTIKVQGIGDEIILQCFQFRCKALRRFQIVSPNVVISRTQVLSILSEHPSLEKCQFNVDEEFHPLKDPGIINHSITDMIVAQVDRSGLRFSAQHHTTGMTVADMLYITRTCVQLRKLVMHNITDRVVDGDLVEVLLSNLNIQVLEISNWPLLNSQEQPQPSEADVQQRELQRQTDVAQRVCNFNMGNTIEENTRINQIINTNYDDKPQAAEVQRIEQFQLKELYLENVFITNLFFKYLFLLNINHQLEKVWLKNLTLITDVSVYILLTGSDMREKVTQQCVSADYTQNKVTQLGGVQEIIGRHLMQQRVQNMSQMDSSNRLRTNQFTCYVNDAIEDERQCYRIQYLSILGCKQITNRITYAIMFTGYDIKFLQLDYVICPKYIKELRRHGDIIFSFVTQQCIDMEILYYYYMFNRYENIFIGEGDREVQFSELR